MPVNANTAAKLSHSVPIALSAIPARRRGASAGGKLFGLTCSAQALEGGLGHPCIMSLSGAVNCLCVHWPVTLPSVSKLGQKHVGGGGQSIVEALWLAGWPVPGNTSLGA